MTAVDITPHNEQTAHIPTAKTAAPSRPGFAVAQAWYACVRERLDTEEDRQGVRALVSSNVLPVYAGLGAQAQCDFVNALGTLVVDFLVDGEPSAGRWDARRSIEEAVASENEEVSA